MDLITPPERFWTETCNFPWEEFWVRDLKPQTELAKFLETWWFMDHFQCKKKSADDGINLKRSYEDLDTHEPRNIEFSPEKSR